MCYCIERAEGWNAVMNDFDTNNFHIWYENMKDDPKKAEKFKESNLAGHVLLKKGERSSLASIASKII